jgi:hypothetical protein
MVLPVENYLYVHTRLRYLAVATQLSPSFAPDGHPNGYAAQQVTAAGDGFNDLLTKFNAAKIADGTLKQDTDTCHDLCVSIYACLKSCFRKDIKSSTAIRALPKEDHSPDRTLARMKAIANLWPTLPNVPGTNGPFVAGDQTKITFAALANDFDATVSAAKLASGDYAGAAALFHKQLGEWDNFVSAALVQGRALFKEGTAQRANIDRVPTAPAPQGPEQASLSLAASPAAGTVHLQFHAEHATSFQIWHKGPGEGQFTQVDDVLLPGDYVKSGLPGGWHEYKGVGVNSRGEGPASEPASIQVAAAAAA